MNKSFWRLVWIAGLAAALAGCGDKETRQALEKATALENQKQYYDANNVLIEALHAREQAIRGDAGTPADPAVADALSKKVKSDPEFLKLQRAQIPIYLRLERPDLAAAVYADILAGNPRDTVVYDALHDKDPVIRIGAVRILGLAGQPDAVDALTGALKDSDQEVRRAAASALGAVKSPRVVGPLIDALKDPYWFVRSEAAEALGQEHDPRAVKPLLDIVGDSDKTAESSAENALLFLCPDPGVRPDDFAARLDDPNPKIVLISAICLATLKDARAIPVLQKLIASPNPTARLDAVKALGESGNPAAIPTLRQTLKDPDINMRGWSIIGLGKLKDQGALPDLRAIAADGTQTPEIKSAATAAINHIVGSATAASPPMAPGE